MGKLYKFIIEFVKLGTVFDMIVASENKDEARDLFIANCLVIKQRIVNMHHENLNCYVNRSDDTYYNISELNLDITNNEDFIEFIKKHIEYTITEYNVYYFCSYKNRNV
jgi:hypothetical protein